MWAWLVEVVPGPVLVALLVEVVVTLLLLLLSVGLASAQGHREDSADAAPRRRGKRCCKLLFLGLDYYRGAAGLCSSSPHLASQNKGGTEGLRDSR